MSTDTASSEDDVHDDSGERLSCGCLFDAGHDCGIGTRQDFDNHDYEEYLDSLLLDNYDD